MAASAYPSANETPSAIRIFPPGTPGGSKQSFWRSLTNFDHSKVSAYRGLRNAAGVVIPLIVGYSLGMPRGGLAFASGALNVCYSDGSDPYPRRAKRMLGSAVLCSLAIFAGAISGPHAYLAIPIATLWAFMAGMMVALGVNAGDLGVISLVSLLIYAAQPLTYQQAFLAGLLALGGGILQTALSVALWPVRRYEHESAALAKLFSELGEAASSPLWSTAAPAASDEFEAARIAISGLDRDDSLEAVRFRSLLNQAQRVRLSVLALARLRLRMAREDNGHPGVALADQALRNSATVLRAIAGALTSQNFANTRLGTEELRQVARNLAESANANGSTFFAAAAKAAAFQIDALAGQLRAVVDVASHTTLSGQLEFDRVEAHQPVSLRFRSIYATLLANLSLQSSAFRHALRLAAMAAIGEALGRGFYWHRSYWLPMTVVIVLKPEFTTTFSRGLLRIGGTVVGLLLATGLFHFLPITVASQIVLIFAFTFLLRWIGPANYGIFGIAVSALVVLMIAITGVAPKDLILARGLNTVGGGILALLAYWLWPTWERTQINERLAKLLEAYAGYFRALADTHLTDAPDNPRKMESARQVSRVARSNFEGSLDRLASEPGTTQEQLDKLNAMRASSHRLIHAVMAVDAAWVQSTKIAVRPAFQRFVTDVEKTFDLLIATLRGARVPAAEFPNLREDHNRLVESGDPTVERYTLVNVEADRITNSLNTLREQILAWCG
jgi:uncharacterized membrane protein YccC